MMNFLFTHTPLKYLIQSFWRDEAFSALLAKQNILSILHLTAQDFNPPLYYLLIHVWIIFFGQSEIALRMFSFVFFWATVFVVYLFLTDIFRLSIKKSFFYLAFFLLNPLLNYYAFEARNYTLLAALVSLSFYLLLKGRKKAYIVISSLGLYTHYFMIFPLLTQALYIALMPQKEKTKKYPNLGTVGVVFLTFIPWLIIVSTKGFELSQGFWILPYKLKDILLIPSYIYLGVEGGFEYPLTPQYIVSLIIYILVAAAIFLLIKNRKKNALLFLLLSWGILIPVLVFFVSFFKPIFLARYLIFSSVGLFLLIVFVLERFSSLTKATIFIILLSLTVNYNIVQIKKRDKDNIRKVISEIKNIASPYDVIYVKNELNFHEVQYYFDKDRVFIYQKSYDEIPSYVGKILIPKEKVTNILPIFPKKAFVIDQNLTYQIQTSI